MAGKKKTGAKRIGTNVKVTGPGGEKLVCKSESKVGGSKAFMGCYPEGSAEAKATKKGGKKAAAKKPAKKGGKKAAAKKPAKKGGKKGHKISAAQQKAMQAGRAKAAKKAKKAKKA